MDVSQSPSTERIRELNDRLRQHGSGGQIVITPALQAFAPDQLAALFRAVAEFQDFSADNDPYGEHDFGRVQVCGIFVFFKIDYYDAHLGSHSPDPADPAVTRRVLSLMQAEEY